MVSGREKLKKFARENIRAMTEVEIKFLKRLTVFGRVSFDFQRVIGFYIVDFIFPDRMLILEIEGSYHKKQKEYDARREKFLKDVGFDVWRISNQNSAILSLDSITDLPIHLEKEYLDAELKAIEFYNRARGITPVRHKKRKLKIPRPRNYQEVNDKQPSINDHELKQVHRLDIDYDGLSRKTEECNKKESERKAQYAQRTIRVVKKVVSA